MKRILLWIALSVPSFLMAQSDVEALRYAMLDLGGTARFIGAGGAFTGLGGDFSSIRQNPAGLGVFRKSEMFFTPEFDINSTSSRYFENDQAEGKLNFNSNGFGFVLNKDHYNGSNNRSPRRWMATNFAFGYNRLANFNNRFSFSGVNPNNSILDRYALDARGTAPSQVYSNFPYGAGLAYEAYLIDPTFPDTTNYIGRAPFGGVEQRQDFRSRGAIDEWSIAMAANVNNRLFIGGTVGIPNLKYIQQTTFSELDVADTIPGFDNFALDERLETRATGINAKIGLLAYLTDNIRVGAAIHTPTLFRMRDQFFSIMYADVENGIYEIESPNGSFQYNLVTPWRAMLGAAAVFPGIGFLSVDYEYVDYSNSSFRFDRISDQAFENSLNDAIDNKYQGVHIIRFGGEYVYDIYRFRAGFNYHTGALQDGLAPSGADYSRNVFTLGYGMRGEVFYMDLAYVYSSFRSSYIPYTLDEIPDAVVRGALIDDQSHRLNVTLGVRF